jgi:PAS domain S-box-containing protein
MPRSPIYRWLRSNLGVATGILVVVGSASVALANLRSAQRQTEWVHHTHEVLFELSTVHRLMDELQAGERGYAISGNEKFLDLYSRAKERIGPQLLTVSHLVAENPEQSRRIAKIEAEVASLREGIEYVVRLTSQGKGDQARAEISTSDVHRRMDDLRTAIDEMENNERAYLNVRLAQMHAAAASSQATLLLGTAIALISLIAAAVALNIRLRKQNRAERQLNQFFDNSLDIFTITDPVGNFLRFNKRITDILGFSAKEIKNLTTLDLIHPADLAYVKAARNRRQSGEDLNGLEFRMRRQDGTYTWVSWQSSYNATDELVYSVGRDVNERRRLEDENARARQLAQEASQAKSDFLASMSHEIRTPMNAIIGMADVLSETPLTEEQAQYVRVFRGAGNSLLNLINDILDLSRIEAGKIEIHDVDFNLRDLVMGIVDLLGLKASQKGLLLEGKVAPDVPAQVKGDPDRLRQVLSNLVGNAVKFTARGNVMLSVNVQARAGKPGVLITVADTGLGIPENSKGRIFGKYERSTATSAVQGSGLGLHISKELTERMGGDIWFESESGKGSQFFCWLPLQASEGKAIEAAPVAEASVRPLEILLTDDNEDNRLIVVSYLKKYPHRISQADNGERALDLFKARSFDLVLMDLHMPVMDGLTAVRAMREFERSSGRPRTTIMALTAYSLKEEEEKSIAAGCDAHLSKPIKKQTLLKALSDFTAMENA